MHLARTLAAMLILGIADATAQQTGDAEPEPVSLAELYRAADLVAVVQIRDGEYAYSGTVPRSGSGHLAVLLPYKNAEGRDMIEVFEQGVGEDTCYFPNPSLFEEGRRYLVFVREDADYPAEKGERYRGLEAGCKLEILVTEDNRYAVRYPPDDIELSDDLKAIARPLAFQDAHATFQRAEMLAHRRDRLVAEGWLKSNETGSTFQWTHGVPLEDLRRLMQTDDDAGSSPP